MNNNLIRNIDSKKRILIVEDELTSRQLLEGLLANSYEISFAGNDLEAYELSKLNPDLILLDFHLPGVNGLEVCNNLKRTAVTEDIPIIFLTASQDIEIELQGLNSGAVDFVTKPYSSSILLARIQKHIDLSNQNKLFNELAHTDKLTGVGNRRKFDSYISTEFTRALRSKSNLSLVIMDLDFFKKINDEFGHEAGDNALRKSSEITLRHLKRTSDVMCRIGGEEFALILPDTNLQGCVALAEAIRSDIDQSFKNLFEKNLVKHQLTASFGCHCITPTNTLELNEFICIADRNLYVAKKTGRNKVVS